MPALQQAPPTPAPASPVGAGDDLLAVDDHELLQDLARELLAALGAVGVSAHAANAHVLDTDGGL